MKERPILFTPENAQKVFDGSKGQTRRIMKPQPELLYSITDDRIEPLYLSKEALDELNSITIRDYTSSDSDLAELGLHGGKRWARVLSDALQGIREKGIRGLVSVSRSQKRQGVLECIVVPRKQEGHAVCSSADLHGISRYAAIPNSSSTAPGRQSIKLRSRQCDLGNTDRELDGSKGARPRGRGREASCGKVDRCGEASPAVGLEGRALQSASCSKNAWDEPVCHIINSRYKVETRLWIREAWAFPGEELHLYKGCPADAEIVEKWEQDENAPQVKWKPSLHMPRWACRTVVELTDVRVERLDKITESDSQAEGVKSVAEFMDLWVSINKTWEPSLWVWVLEFRKVSS